MEGAQLVALLGAKGGCGTTTVTANLAANLPHGSGVCAIDMDHGKGDLAAMLDLRPTTAVPQLLTRDCDPTLLRGCAVDHPAGFEVLGQPQDMSQLVRPTPSEVGRLLEVTRDTWGLVLLDCGSRVDDAVLAALREADHVAIVTTTDVLAARDTVRVRALLSRMGIPEEHQWVIVNGVGRGLSVDELEQVLGVRVSATLPRDDAACARALEVGALLQEVAPHAALSRCFPGLWATLNGEKPARRTWRLPWMRGVA